MAGPLAQKVRAKFPGVYDDIDDATLEARVLAKHPEYQDLATEPDRGTLLGAVGKGIVQGMGYAPLKAGYDQIKSIIDDPIGAIPGVTGQLGAMGGMALGGPVGGVAGAAAGGAAGQSIANMIKARPYDEGVGGAAITQGAIQSIPIVGRGLKYIGNKAMGRAVGPPASIIGKMAESRGKTPQEVRSYLADVSYEHNIPPTAGGLRDAMNTVNANTAEQKVMETAAGEAGKSINMRSVLKATRKSSLNYRKPGASIRNIEADTRPAGAIAATKAALQETATQHPELSVPFTSARSTTKAGGILPEEAVSVRQGSIPNPEAAPSVVGDVRRGVNMKLVDAYGIDPETKAGIVVDKAWTHDTGKRLAEATEGTGTRAYGDIGKESHDLLNLVDAIRQRSYNTATNPVRLYEFLGALSGNPEAIGLGLASRPSVMWNFGRGNRKWGELAQTINPAAVRAALLARLGGNEQR